MSDTVTVTAPVSYRAWPTPDEAFLDMPPRPKQEGMQALPSIAVADLAPQVLDALAKQWLDHLYAGVGRASPFSQVSAP